MVDPNVTRFKPHFLAAPLAYLLSTRVLEIAPNHVTLITGLFDKDEKTVAISQITDVTVVQGCLGAIFDIRNLAIQTSGSDATAIVFNKMSKARKARDLLLKYIADSEK